MKTLSNIHRLISSIIFFTLLTSVQPSFAQRKVIITGSEVTHKLISEKTIYMEIEFLSDSLCNGRATGSQGGIEAGMWVARQFKRLGIKPVNGSYSQSFEASDGSVGRNIIGMLPAAGNNTKRRYMIIAAHYDGIGQLDGAMYPGADSNASGIAAMLNVGRMISAMVSYGKVYRQNIIFVALDAKNLSMGGAKALWTAIENKELINPVTGEEIGNDNISMMVNIDQIGSCLSPLASGNKNFIIMLSDSNADFHRGSLKYASSRYEIDLELGFDYYGSSSFTEMFYKRVSDQKIFLENGIPSVMFTSGITMNNNKVRDTVDTLDMTVLKHRIWIIFHWIERTI